MFVRIFDRLSIKMSAIKKQMSPETGANNAVEVCMGVKPGERVLIVSDRSTKDLGQLLKDASTRTTPPQNVTMFILEDFAQRPLKRLPQEIEDCIATSDVTFWLASSFEGELPVRNKFIRTAIRNARHGHMPGFTAELMEQGMCADYEEVFKLTHQVYDIVSKAKKIRMTSSLGLDVEATFDDRWTWVPSDGRYREKGKWGNLPEGETFTAPKTLNGRLVTNLLGDYFSRKFGNFKETLSFSVTDSMIDFGTLECGNSSLRTELLTYLKTDENSRRASELALPTNPLLISLPTVGNLLQDEKARPHIAFGDPYTEETGAPWSSETHIDMILEDCTVTVDGTRKIMENGRYQI